MVIVLLGLVLGAIAVNRASDNEVTWIVVVAVVAFALLVTAIARANLWWRSTRQVGDASTSMNTYVAYGSLGALFFVAIASLFVG